jgi:FixJ family two-component response regulator
MDDYVSKPVRSQTLTDVLERWISASADAPEESMLQARAAS